MRVIAGEKRHLLLKTIDSNDIRPTTDKIKETLFNIIQFKLKDVVFLDLFAGSGAIGIEALSRGAKKAIFVDNNKKAIDVINLNLENTKLLDKSLVLFKDAKNAIKYLNDKNELLDIVFMDPPYDKDLYYDCFLEISKSNIINEDTIIIIESSIEDNIEKVKDLGFEIERVKEYKNQKHTFLRKCR